MSLLQSSVPALATMLLLGACAPESNSYQGPGPQQPYGVQGQWQQQPRGAWNQNPQGYPNGPSYPNGPYPNGQPPMPGQPPQGWSGPGNFQPTQPQPQAIPTIPGFPGLPQLQNLPAASAWWPNQWGTPPLIWSPQAPVAPQIPPAPQVPGVPVVNSNDPPQRCVDTINRYRAGMGLAALQRWTQAEACASSQGLSGSQTNKPHGAFGQCGEMAQNVCPNWPGPADSVTDPCLKSMYDEGPGTDFQAHGHYLNMTNPKYGKVACGYFTSPSGSVWAVQDFQ